MLTCKVKIKHIFSVFRRTRDLSGHLAGELRGLVQQPDPEVDPDVEVLRRTQEGQTVVAQNG
jgi:hypothetical protein